MLVLESLKNKKRVAIELIEYFRVEQISKARMTFEDSRIREMAAETPCTEDNSSSVGQVS